MKQIIFSTSNYYDDEDDEDYEITMSHEQVKYHNWVYDKKGYSPAIEIEIVKTIKPGVYKINDEYKCIPQNLANDELCLLPGSKIEEILAEADSFWERKEVFKEYNFIHKRGILLEGPAGTGKTSIINLLCEKLVNSGGVVFLINNILDFTRMYDFLKKYI